MAILIEAISVVVRINALHRNYEGGRRAFEENAPNKTLCSDDEIARVGFMAPADARAFAEALERNGLVYLEAVRPKIWWWSISSAAHV